ncbi:hypothetical protein CVT26_007393 [Gymnopilus dilepis]|uniref:Transmembrane protein n=1 Tax=Gymnopilus dilepis TaxID=231916 RepID=A0A409X158_9AGAR|nr:hypothetical protein CVT26_007393 [Gymnopilus dilepis]
MSSPYTNAFASTSNVTLEHTNTNASLNPITPAITHSTWTAPPLRVLDPLDASFGYTLSSSRTHESRHDEHRLSLSSEVAPPPYAAEAGIPLPEYSLRAPEPVTLAMYLFFFGFLFPPFWFFGAFILCSPLREPPTSSEDGTPAWMPEKTEEERKEMIANLRAVELKWAKRCLYALLAVVMTAVIAGLLAWQLSRH